MVGSFGQVGICFQGRDTQKHDADRKDVALVALLCTHLFLMNQASSPIYSGGYGAFAL